MSDKQLVNLKMEPDLLELLEDFRFTNRFPSRAEAMKWLLRWALERNPVPPKDR